MVAPISANAAGTGVTAPADGAVITSGTQVTASASFDVALDMQLRVTAPDAGEQVLASAGGVSRKLSGVVAIRRNGEYTLRLRGTLTGHVYDTNTFYVRVPPAAPAGITGSVSGARLTVSWNLGLEDDLTRYSVKANGIGSASGSPSSLCSGTMCSKSFSLDSGDTGTTTVSVRAYRSNGQGGSIGSGTAGSSVQLPGAGGSGGTGGTGSGDPTTLSPPNYHNGGQAPAISVNEDSPVTLPNVQPSGAAPGSVYQVPEVAGQPSTAIGHAATDDLQWGKSIATALVLLIVAAHLGTWTRRMRVAYVGVSRRGMAARVARSGTGRTRVKRMRSRIAEAEAVAKSRDKTAKRSPRGHGKSTASGSTDQPRTKSVTVATGDKPAKRNNRPATPEAGLPAARDGAEKAALKDVHPDNAPQPAPQDVAQPAPQGVGRPAPQGVGRPSR
jgi:hypothetical protein